MPLVSPVTPSPPSSGSGSVFLSARLCSAACLFWGAGFTKLSPSHPVACHPVACHPVVCYRVVCHLCNQSLLPPVMLTTLSACLRSPTGFFLPLASPNYSLRPSVTCSPLSPCHPATYQPPTLSHFTLLSAVAATCHSVTSVLWVAVSACLLDYALLLVSLCRWLHPTTPLDLLSPVTSVTCHNVNCTPVTPSLFTLPPVTCHPVTCHPVTLPPCHPVTCHHVTRHPFTCHLCHLRLRPPVILVTLPAFLCCAGLFLPMASPNYSLKPSVN